MRGSQLPLGDAPVHPALLVDDVCHVGVGVDNSRIRPPRSPQVDLASRACNGAHHKRESCILDCILPLLRRDCSPPGRDDIQGAPLHSNNR